MPTRSGKTAVLMLTPFVLRAQRALGVTPPAVKRVDHRAESADAWEELRETE